MGTTRGYGMGGPHGCDPLSAGTHTMVETVELGRDAMDRHAWAEAVDVFAAADRDGGLAPADLERLGTAAWWAGQPDAATEALERAFAGYADAGQSSDAARVALALAYQAFRRQAVRSAAGGSPGPSTCSSPSPDSPSHAQSRCLQALGALMANRITEGIELADRAMALAQALNDPDSNFMAMSFKGMAMVFSGDWQAGFALIDEAATAASSGQLDLRIASDIYCNTIAACRNVGDLKRAGQWADEGERWMRRQSVGGYPGICRVHRAELKMLRGLWSEAEQEARQACDGARALRAPGWRRLCPLRRRRGSVADRRPGRRRRGVRAGLRVRARRAARDGAPPAGPRRDRRGGAVDRPRARRDRRRRWTRGPGDAGPSAPGPDRHRAGGRRPGDRRPRGRRAGIDRHRLPATRLRGRRAHGARRAAPRRGSAVGGVADPGTIVAALAADGPAVRERSGAPPLCRGDGGRRRPGHGSTGTCGLPGRCSSGSARDSTSRGSTRCSGRTPRLARTRDAADDQDLHVHRHRHVDRPGRADRRRRLGRAAAVA